LDKAVTVVGTPYYLSPEACQSQPYTYKSDIWSVGCVLYELCQLRPAFNADNLLTLLFQIINEN
jgi:NIMA (never in mitosis gene a)-related kinase 1/4/5